MNTKTKGDNMNKLTKIGVSALCGSLATVASAQAGEMTVTGGASMTYMSLSDEVTGNPLGMATGMTFTGTGDVNDSTVTLTIANTHKNAYTGSSIAVATPSLGTFKYDEKGGTGLDRIDDMMPTAWEEVDGAGVGMGLQTVSGVGGGSDIEWTLPSEWSMGSTVHISYSFKPDGSYNSKKGAGGTNGTSGLINGSGYDIVVTNNSVVEGLNMFAGYSTINQSGPATHALDDREQLAGGATYAVGGFTLGYQQSYDSAATSYDNTAYGVSFAVNDNLSISYANHDSKQSQSDNTRLELEGKSLQASYTMGGASLVVAETEVDNKNYATAAANQREGRSIALTLAF